MVNKEYVARYLHCYSTSNMVATYLVWCWSQMLVILVEEKLVFYDDETYEQACIYAGCYYILRCHHLLSGPVLFLARSNQFSARKWRQSRKTTTAPIHLLSLLSKGS